jgi:hypothetical protein
MKMEKNPKITMAPHKNLMIQSGLRNLETAPNQIYFLSVTKLTGQNYSRKDLGTQEILCVPDPVGCTEARLSGDGLLWADVHQPFA